MSVAIPSGEAVPARARSLRHFTDLLYVLLSKEFKVRYKSTFLGYVWSLLHPLAYAMIFYFVFKLVARLDVPEYAVFLISGLFPWQWLQNSLASSVDVFLGNATLIKKLRFPRWLLVVASVVGDGIHFLLALPVMVLFMWPNGHAPHASWLVGIPLLCLLQGALLCATALILATMNLFLRDLARLIGIFLQLGFYLTPVVYPIGLLPEAMRPLVWLNPAAVLVEAWRGLLLEGRIDVAAVVALLAWTAIVALVARTVYVGRERRFAELV